MAAEHALPRFKVFGFEQIFGVEEAA